MHLPPYKSETKPFTASSYVEFTDFVPPRGPNGGRNVIDKLFLCINGTITVATATWDGRDVCRLAQLISVEDRAGRQRWALSGYKTRIASIHLNGIEEHMEHADLTAGAGKAVDLRLLIPMTKQWLRRGKDFAIAADVFRKVGVTFNSLAGAATSTTVLSAASLNVYILAETHEEFSVEFKAEDVVKSVDFQSNTQARLPTQGAVHDLIVCREPAGGGTAGGDVITAITDARIEDLNVPVLTRQDFLGIYSVKRKLAPSGTTTGGERFTDPSRQGVALPILVADYETSAWDGKVLDSIKIDVGTGAAGLSLISREVCEKSQANYNAQVARFGIDPRTIRMKTAGKSRRGLGDGWSKRQQVVAVWSAALPAA